MEGNGRENLKNGANPYYSPLATVKGRNSPNKVVYTKYILSHDNLFSVYAFTYSR